MGTTEEAAARTAPETAVPHGYRGAPGRPRRGGRRPG